MGRVGNRAMWVFGAVLVLTLGVVACGSSPEPAPTASETPAVTETPTATESASTSPTAEPTDTLDGAALVQGRCTTCHNIDRIAAEDGSPAKWGGIVERMIAKGAELNGQEKQTVVDYLAATYPDN